jgi:hypothetical protein
MSSRRSGDFRVTTDCLASFVVGVGQVVRAALEVNPLPAFVEELLELVRAEAVLSAE